MLLQSRVHAASDWTCALCLQDLRSRRLRQIQQEEGDAEEPQAGDEDAERESWLKQIALASLKAADRLSSIHQVCTALVLRAAQMSWASTELAGLAAGVHPGMAAVTQ